MRELLSLKAGKMIRDGNTLQPESSLRKGRAVFESDPSGKIIFTWRLRPSDEQIDQTTIIPGQTIVRVVPGLSDSFAFQVKTSTQNLFYWIQEPNMTQDRFEEIIDQINRSIAQPSRQQNTQNMTQLPDDLFRFDQPSTSTSQNQITEPQLLQSLLLNQNSLQPYPNIYQQPFIHPQSQPSTLPMNLFPNGIVLPQNPLQQSSLQQGERNQNGIQRQNIRGDHQLIFDLSEEEDEGEQFDVEEEWEDENENEGQEDDDEDEEENQVDQQNGLHIIGQEEGQLRNAFFGRPINPYIAPNITDENKKENKEEIEDEEDIQDIIPTTRRIPRRRKMAAHESMRRSATIGLIEDPNQGNEEDDIGRFNGQNGFMRNGNMDILQRMFGLPQMGLGNIEVIRQPNQTIINIGQGQRVPGLNMGIPAISQGNQSSTVNGIANNTSNANTGINTSNIPGSGGIGANQTLPPDLIRQMLIRRSLQNPSSSTSTGINPAQTQSGSSLIDPRLLQNLLQGNNQLRMDQQGANGAQYGSGIYSEASRQSRRLLIDRAFSNTPPIDAFFRVRNMRNILQDPEAIRDILPLLPEPYRTPERLEEILRSPLFHHQVLQLETASEQMDPLTLMTMIGMRSAREEIIRNRRNSQLAPQLNPQHQSLFPQDQREILDSVYDNRMNFIDTLDSLGDVERRKEQEKEQNKKKEQEQEKEQEKEQNKKKEQEQEKEKEQELNKDKEKEKNNDEKKNINGKEDKDNHRDDDFDLQDRRYLDGGKSGASGKK
ncbi:MAG: hypothetical protein EZS28_007559 [Streblomastix strix]|uniref:Pru domain-containing protein n=1 Tax=Streblomastix strix TaxID=222440 RepID=A0A5J4WPP1_9EUKA|nr:MAG: hypothetical protein EZS28_007559 [Streblomastix strix]